ncbi:MAG: hypothetical protein ABIR08_09325 [Sphingomonas sp.]
MRDQPPSPSPAAEPEEIAPDDYLLTFATVPGRARRDGWTPDRQRGFIEVLRTTGVVAAAARAVGKSGVSAYNLRKRPGAEGFAAAWDRALDDARDDALDLAMERVRHGYVTPRTYRGRFVALVHRFDHRLAFAALSFAHRAAAKVKT